MSNERGGTTLMVVFVMVILLTGVMMLSNSGMSLLNRVTKDTNDKTIKTYQEDSAVEITKYILVNELAALQWSDFDGNTPILDDETLQEVKSTVNQTIASLYKDTAVDLEVKETAYISEVCEKVFDSEGDFVGYFCEYSPLTITISYTYRDSGEKEKLRKGFLTLQDIYLYENSGNIGMDTTQTKDKYTLGVSKRTNE